MTRVCIVKQNTTYDLFTRTGPDLRAIVDSSNWRSGPLGLWEAFDTTASIVWEDPAPECQLGKSHWQSYVQGWDIWPSGRTAQAADDIDWGMYDAVISVDVAVPTRIIERFRSVMWCYYFIEGGPTGIDGPFRGSPFFGYNVFLDHRLAKNVLSTDSASWRQMRETRRAVLDFPYYMQSARSVSLLYPELAHRERHGCCLSHHSRIVLTPRDQEALSRFGPVRLEWSTLADIHRAQMASRYFIVHPESMQSAGLALIEAVSAGCVVLAPRHRLWGFPELVLPELDFAEMDGLLDLLRILESDPALLHEVRELQASRVDDWCFANPTRNFETLLSAFRDSDATPARQRRAEVSSQVGATVAGASSRIARAAARALSPRGVPGSSA